MEKVNLFRNLKILKKLEVIFGTISFFSLVLSLLRFPFGDELLIFSVGFLAIYYLILGIFIYRFEKSDSSGTKFAKVVFSFYACSGYSVCLLGVLFKLLLWPGDREMMLTAFVSAIMMFVLTFIFWLIFRSKFLQSHLITSFIFLFFSSGFYTISAHSIIDIRYKNQPDCILIIKQSYDNPRNEELKSKASECKYKHNYK
jgi:hypothetical protein